MLAFCCRTPEHFPPGESNRTLYLDPTISSLQRHFRKMATRAALGTLLPPLLIALPLLIFAGGGAQGRRILSTPALASDGLRGHDVGVPKALLNVDLARSTEKCEQTYGFLPCTTTVVGNLFLLVVYGYLMYLAATYLSTGSEMLLEILGPGLIGGLVLPILGALPDSILVLVSGIGGSRVTAQQQVLIGIGLLAGSTVMLLTVVWGTCVVVGKCDLSANSVSIDSQDTKKFSLFGSGISVDRQTLYAARIMVISLIPFVIIQLPKVFKISSGQRIAVLITLVFSIASLLSYCLYQVFQPWIQSRRLEYVKRKHLISGILRHAQREVLGRLLNDDGSPNIPVIEKLFRKLDLDSDNLISCAELSALIIGIEFEEIDFDKDEAVDKVMADFDTTGDEKIDLDEFIRGISKWLNEAKHSIAYSGSYSKKFIIDFHEKTRQEHNMLVDGTDDHAENVDNTAWIYFKAVSLLILGTVIAAAFADPLVDAVDNFSSATRIPSFFISFIALPLATNSSEAVSAIIFASRKKKRTLSLTFSEIYGAVTMNNTLGLAVFLAIIYLRHLTWDFSAEVLVILVACLVMGLFSSFRTTFPLWTCFVAYLMYPLSLVLVYILDYVFGWW